MSKKILIVDDSLVSRMMIKEIVSSKYPNWIYAQAASSEKALDACQKEQFDFITMDLNMPGASGLEIAPQLLAIQSDVQIALITGNADPGVQKKAAEIGVSYINKPINEAEILGFVSQE